MSWDRPIGNSLRVPKGCTSGALCWVIGWLLACVAVVGVAVVGSMEVLSGDTGMVKRDGEAGPLKRKKPRRPTELDRGSAGRGAGGQVPSRVVGPSGARRLGRCTR
ncbi:hypothetical protein GCM10014715_28530 [Streptomyces spiralis]|uniref:Uncharacterized protein n=1 Tax=Streptomyces spiralis TaxID=66376 RepID=A0A918ZWM3_9ACTN|nr:hypothetical protein GCM10014715_28530 [Streptomyces spiralis]